MSFHSTSTISATSHLYLMADVGILQLVDDVVELVNCWSSADLKNGVASARVFPMLEIVTSTKSSL